MSQSTEVVQGGDAYQRLEADHPMDGNSRTEDIYFAVAALAAAPCALGGLWLRGWAGPRRDAVLALAEKFIQAAHHAKPLRIAHHTEAEQLHDGLDLTSTLHVGHPVVRPGLIQRASGGVIQLAMAERASRALQSQLTVFLDVQDFALLACDESLPEEAGLMPALTDRLGLGLDLRNEEGLWPSAGVLTESPLAEYLVRSIPKAGKAWQGVALNEDVLKALTIAAGQLGLDSMRPVFQAANSARIVAALQGRSKVDHDDLASAVRLCLLPRATRLPSQSSSEVGDKSDSQAEEDAQAERDLPTDYESMSDELDGHDSQPESTGPMEGQGMPDASGDRIVEAALASLPPDLLLKLAASLVGSHGKSTGQSGAGAESSAGRGRGRPIGAIARKPRSGERLHLLATLRRAAPFQRIRQMERVRPNSSSTRILLRADDLHVWREKKRRGTTTVFVVDASGSMALQRLSEAKGAVELLLADCYVRRDRVALVSFRGTGADLLLAPTRSLVAAKRALQGLPGGGGSPIAAGFEAAARLVHSLRREGDNTVLVVLTDGKANLSRDGKPGREQASLEAKSLARQLAVLADKRLLIDTSVRSEAMANELAKALDAVYLPMPFAQAKAVADVVKASV
ncbi:MAG: VWA domain-containing protein [Bordetella sp.]